MLRLIITFFIFSVCTSQPYSFKVKLSQAAQTDALTGRLFLVLSQEKQEPNFTGIYYPDINHHPVFGIDVNGWNTSETLYFNSNELYGFPQKYFKDLKEDNWYIYAYFKEYYDQNLLEENSVKYYSKPLQISLSNKADIEFILEEQVADVYNPKETEFVKYEKIESKFLSDFWGRDMGIYTQVVLPKTFYSSPKKKYPLLILMSGLTGRYYEPVLSEEDIQDSETPEMLIIRVDSKAPFGDSYQMNSANNGPYADALIQEVIPFIEKKYRGVGDHTSRFLTGTSTGGWASLALQIFYPDVFNGAWSTCADAVDFRKFGLINLYEEENVFVNQYGWERPGMRDVNGEIQYMLSAEILAENVMGRYNSYTTSGGQWGSWMATFSPKDKASGLPMPIFDPETGDIDKNVLAHWRQYDLRYYLSENWESLGDKLQGKLHIWMGTMDNYYLNNAMLLFEEFMQSTTNPTSDAQFHFICGEGHDCGTHIPFKTIMSQMVSRYQDTKVP
jgi:hypothetical protein